MLASIFPLISAVVFLSFAIAVVLSDTRASIKWIFALLCLSTFWWQFSWFILFNTQDMETAALLAKVGHIGILFLPVWLYHLNLLITGTQGIISRVVLYTSYAISLGALGILLTTDYIIQGVHDFSWGFYPAAGILHPFFIALVVTLMLCSVRILWNTYRDTTSVVKQQQIKYFFYAIISYNIAAVDFVTNYGVDMYPVGFVAIILFIFLIWQGISQHYLLNISQYFKYIFSYIFVFVYAWLAVEIYTVAMSRVEHLSSTSLDELARLFAIAVLVGGAVVIYNYSQTLIEYALGDYRDPNRLLIKIHEEITGCLSRDELLHTMSQILSFIFPVDHAYVLAEEDETTVIPGKQSTQDHPLGMESLKGFAGKDQNLPQELVTTSTLKYFALNQGTQEQVLEEMRRNAIGLIAPMYNDDEFVGNLILGEKPYQESYTEEEKRFIERITPLFTKKLISLDT
jgi:hypothetical protein